VRWYAENCNDAAGNCNFWVVWYSSDVLPSPGGPLSDYLKTRFRVSFQ
jgi:hypothetical protein